jgi:chitodextrinase
MDKAIRSVLCVLLAALLVSGCSESDQPTSPSKDTTAPSVPTQLTSAAVGSTRINLSWTASTDNVGITGYEIHRGGTKVGTSTTTSYADIGLTPSTEYCYVVKAYDAAENLSSSSNQACATTLPQGADDTAAPSAPTNLTAIAVGSTQVNLSWTPSTDNIGVTGYDVYRNGVRVGSSTTPSYADAGLEPSTQYCYVIKAYDAAGNVSPASSQACTVTGSQSPEYTASGTYSYNHSAGTLVLNVAHSDFPCNGPSIGSQTFTVVSLTATTLVFRESGGEEMTWTRTSGISGDITGTWHFTNPGGDYYEFTMRANSSFTLLGRIAESCFADAWSRHWFSGYSVDVMYRDPQHLASSVTVTGPGITGAMALGYDSDNGRWGSWIPPGSQIFFGPTHPQPPLTYVFAVTGGSGTRMETAVVECFMDELPSNLSPTGTIAGNPTFTWTRVGQTHVQYQVQLEDADYARIWESDELEDMSSVVYNGPPLTPGMTYQYYVQAQTNSGSCSSLATGSFTFASGE